MIDRTEAIARLDRFFSVYWDCDISTIRPGEVRVVASPRRERPEPGYARTFAVWVLITEGRCAVSVQARLLEPVATAVRSLRFEPGPGRPWQQELLGIAERELVASGRLKTGSYPIYYCTSEGFREQNLKSCRPVGLDVIEGLRKTELNDWGSLDLSIAEGTCFAAYEGDRPVALAGTHKDQPLSDEVAEVNVPGTLTGFRRRGFGKTVVSATTAAALAAGKVPLYPPADDNIASINTALSLGYQLYGWRFAISIGE